MPQRVLTLDTCQVRMPNGMIAEVVPVQALQQRRMQKLFGPGDLPIPIEGDGLPGGDAHVVPGNFALLLCCPIFRMCLMARSCAHNYVQHTP